MLVRLLILVVYLKNLTMTQQLIRLKEKRAIYITTQEFDKLTVQIKTSKISKQR